eukprot:COSAG06_NODE_314_length_17706_cov_366.601940_9_plen_81_part_00
MAIAASPPVATVAAPRTATPAIAPYLLQWILFRLCTQSVFLRHLYIKMIILPRQARDKHRKNSKKSAVSSRQSYFAAVLY